MSWRDDDQRCEQLEHAAPFVLGSFDADESARYREHLASCAACREQVAELQPVVDLLPATAPREQASDALRARIMATVRSQAELLAVAGPDADRPPSRRRGWRSLRIALPAGAALAAAGVAVGALAIAPESPSQRVIPALVRGAATGGHAELRETDARAELIVSGMPQPAAGRIYQVWLQRPNRLPEPTTALFSVTRGGAGAVAIPGRLRGVQRVMVTAEPLGGSRLPTTKPIVVVAL